MRGIAQFMVHGRVGSDPDYSALANGTHRLRFSVCANLPRLKDNKWEYQAVWFNFAYFGDAADRNAAKIKKGLPIVVTGEITNYERDINGTNVQMHNFRPMTVSIIDEAERLGRQGQPRQQSAPQGTGQARPLPIPGQGAPAAQPAPQAAPPAAQPAQQGTPVEYPDPGDFGNAFDDTPANPNFSGDPDDDIPF